MTVWNLAASALSDRERLSRWPKLPDTDRGCDCERERDRGGPGGETVAGFGGGKKGFAGER